MAKDLARIAKDQGIRYFLICLRGPVRHAAGEARPGLGDRRDAEGGAGFAGFATWLDMTPADPDMFAMPDPDSLIQLPWQPEVGWLAGDLWMDGREVEASPRAALKRQIAKAASQGFGMKSGVECEYFLLSRDGRALADEADAQEKPCYDCCSGMSRRRADRSRTEVMMAAAAELGEESRTLREIDLLLRGVPGARTEALPLVRLLKRARGQRLNAPPNRPPGARLSSIRGSKYRRDESEATDARSSRRRVRGQGVQVHGPLALV